MWVDAGVAGRFLADERLAQAMMRAATRLLDDRLDVEDALQTARASLLASFMTRPRDVEDFAPYAVAAATYSALRVAKTNTQRDQGRVPDSDTATVADPDAEAKVDLTAERLALVECLAQLTPQHRMALIMHSEGMSYREIGDQLDRPADTVRGWFPQIRSRMRKCLGGRRRG